MRRINFLGFLLVIAVAATPYAFGATPKAGASCPKLNQSNVYAGQTLTCLKKNGKLIWTVTKTTPISQPSPKSSNSSNSGTQTSTNNGQGQGSTSNSNNNNQPYSADQMCTTPEAKKTVDGKIYICTNVKGTLIWVEATSNSSNQGPSNSKNSTPDWMTGNWDVFTDASLSPACSSTIPLTKSIVDLSNIKSITPLGFVQQDAHNTPVPHLYFNALPATGLKDSNGLSYNTIRFPVYAPADMHISGVITTITSPYTEYSVGAHICGTWWVAFNHLDDVLPELKALANQNNKNQLFDVIVKAGTQIGVASGRAHGFDFRAMDASQPIANRVNPRAFSVGWATAVCGLDWFPPAISSAYYSKLATSYSTNQCGTPGKDISGTASGAWLNESNPSNAFANGEKDTFSFVQHNSDPALAYFSVGTMANFGGLRDITFTYKWSSSGLASPLPSNVKSGDVACIDNLVPQGSNSGESYPRVYVQYIGASAGQLEKVIVGIGTIGQCGSGPYVMPATSKTFARYNIPSSNFRK
jgi:hypothetical protein